MSETELPESDTIKIARLKDSSINHKKIFIRHCHSENVAMLNIILIALAAIVVALVVVVSLQPSEFRVVRNTTISGPAPAVFAQVNDFHKWEAWNPWGKIDPAMKQAYEGAPAGTGAVYSWIGNREVGEGRMRIIESRPSDLIRINLECFKPFAGNSIAEFTFKPEGNQTAVTWSMTGTNNFTAKAIHLFMNMDKMIGGQFEKGLAAMKSIVEKTLK
jgi:hypothetical protein